MEEFAVGIDIGGTNTVFGVVDKAGKVIWTDSISTTSYPRIESFIDELSARIEKLFPANSEIIGIGVGAPNGNYYSGTIEDAPNLIWKGIIPLAKMLEEKIKKPVILTNDANAAAIGEMIFGGARYMNNFVVITLGTGVGSGIVVNGELVYGHDGFAGEIGHSIVIPDGRKCACGRNGCLEAYACASGIVKTAVEILQKDTRKSILREKPIVELSAKMIGEAALKNDSIALEVFDYTGKMLGLKLSDTVAHLSPEAIFIFGGVANAGDILFKPVKKYLEFYLLSIFKNKVKILPSAIQHSQAAILGTSALAWKEFGK